MGKQEGCQAGDRSSRLCYNICQRETTRFLLRRHFFSAYLWGQNQVFQGKKKQTKKNMTFSEPLIKRFLCLNLSRPQASSQHKMENGPLNAKLQHKELKSCIISVVCRNVLIRDSKMNRIQSNCECLLLHCSRSALRSWPSPFCVNYTCSKRFGLVSGLKCSQMGVL